MQNNIAEIARPLFVIEWWNLLILIPVTIACIVLAIYIITKFKQFRELSIGGLKIKQTAQEALKAHVSCLHRYSLGNVFALLSDLNMKIYDTRSRGIISDQMHKAEECILLMKDYAFNEVRNNINAVLVAQNIQMKAIQHDDYLNFKLAAQEYFARFKDTIRSACLNNGFAEASEVDYADYMSKMHARLEVMAAQFFGDNLTFTLMSTTDILTKENIRKLHEMIDGMFLIMKKIALKKYEEIAEFERKKEFLMLNEWGIDITKEKEIYNEKDNN